jgi:Flp pilus assembly protein TadD
MKITIQQAIAAHQEGKFEEAEAYYKNVIKLKPDYAEAHNNLAVLLYSLGRLIESETCCKQAIKYMPGYEDAYYNLGNVYQKFTKFSEAEESYKKAIELRPDYAEAHNNLGAALQNLERFDEAEVSFKKAIESKPYFAEAHCNLGALMLLLGKLEEAQISYKKAIEYKPGFIEADKNLTVIFTYNQLLSKILKKKNSNNSVKRSFIKKLYIKLFDSDQRLDSYPFFTHRKVEADLIPYIYKINTMKLDKTHDARFGNGICSDFNFFDNNSPIIRHLAKDLINIMEQAVKSKIFIIESFFNIIGAGSGATIHNHNSNLDKLLKLSNQKYSFFYYISLGDQNCTEPGILKLYNNKKQIIKKILPSDGKIIITRANQLHSAAYNGKTDRIMIGVNFYSLA